MQWSSSTLKRDRDRERFQSTIKYKYNCKYAVTGRDTDIDIDTEIRLEKCRTPPDFVSDNHLFGVPQNPEDTLCNYAALASVMEVLGRAQEAEPVQVKALEGFRAKLGEAHPDTVGEPRVEQTRGER